MDQFFRSKSGKNSPRLNICPRIFDSRLTQLQNGHKALQKTYIKFYLAIASTVLVKLTEQEDSFRKLQRRLKMKVVWALIVCVIWETTIAVDFYEDRQYGSVFKGEAQLFQKYYHLPANDKGVEGYMHYPNSDEKKVYFNITRIVIRDYDIQNPTVFKQDPHKSLGKMKCKFDFSSLTKGKIQIHIYIYGVYIGPCSTASD